MDKQEVENKVKLVYDLDKEYNMLNDRIKEQQSLYEDIKSHINEEYENRNNLTARSPRFSGQLVGSLSANLVSIQSNINSTISNMASLRLKINDQTIKLKQMDKDEVDGDTNNIIKNLLEYISEGKSPVIATSNHNLNNVEFVEDEDADNIIKSGISKKDKKENPNKDLDSVKNTINYLKKNKFIIEFSDEHKEKEFVLLDSGSDDVMFELGNVKDSIEDIYDNKKDTDKLISYLDSVKEKMTFDEETLNYYDPNNIVFHGFFTKSLEKDDDEDGKSTIA